MNTKNTWITVALAAGLFAFIYFYERHAFQREIPIKKVLPYLNTDTITGIQISPAGVKDFHADRTNDTWQLTKPTRYPAHDESIEQFLKAMSTLTYQSRITALELKDRPKTDAEFGFDHPKYSFVLLQGESGPRIKIGDKTALRDQVFLKVVGDEGVYVVDAAFLKTFPRQANDWRESRFLNLKGVPFDRLAVVNGAKSFELQRTVTNQLWHISRPITLRADNPKIEDLLQKLQSLRVSRFVTDETDANLATFGLQPPELELLFAQATNELFALQIGRSPTNDASLVYARRRDQNSVVLVPKDALNPWRALHTDFRDRFLVTLSGSARLISRVEARGATAFTVQRQTNDTWRVIEPDTLPADTGLVQEFLAGLAGMQIAEFVKDVVTDPDLPTYGLATPVRQFILQAGETNPPAGTAPLVASHIDFGAVRDHVIFARRSDENSVYAVKLADYQRLPAAGWQLRDRRIWQFTTNEVTRISIRENGQVRQLLRNNQQWSLAPGSQGILDDVSKYAIEETVYRLGDLVAAAWVDRGDTNRARFGFTDNSLQLAIDLKRDDKPQTLNVEFGALSPSKYPYAAVTLDGQRWTFEFPWLLYQQLLLYLTNPAVPGR